MEHSLGALDNLVAALKMVAEAKSTPMDPSTGKALYGIANAMHDAHADLHARWLALHRSLKDDKPATNGRPPLGLVS